MRKISKAIFEFPKKLEIIIDTLARASAIEEASLKALCNAADIKQSTLRSTNYRFIASHRFCSVSCDVQDKLARVAKFKTTDPTWIDSKAPPGKGCASHYDNLRKDSAVQFEHMLQNRWGMGDINKLRVSNSVPLCAHPNLATFTLTDFGQSTDIKSPIPFFLQLFMSSGEYHESGYGFGFQRVRLRLVLDDYMSNCVDAPLASFSKNIVYINRAELKCALPYWDIFSPHSVLDGDYDTKGDDPLFKLKDQVAGNQFSAILEVRLLDGIIQPNGKTLSSEAHEAIIRTLITKDLKGDCAQVNIRHGWMELARQAYKIVAEG
jgi:hypothetical protein